SIASRAVGAWFSTPSCTSTVSGATWISARPETVSARSGGIGGGWLQAGARSASAIPKGRMYRLIRHAPSPLPDSPARPSFPLRAAPPASSARGHRIPSSAREEDQTGIAGRASNVMAVRRGPIVDQTSKTESRAAAERDDLLGFDGRALEDVATT